LRPKASWASDMLL